MKQETLVHIQLEIRDIRSAVDLYDQFMNPDEVHGGRNIHGHTTVNVILQHLLKDNTTVEKLELGLKTIKAINKATGLGNHVLNLVEEQLSMAINGNLMSEMYEEGEIH